MEKAEFASLKHKGQVLKAFFFFFFCLSLGQGFSETVLEFGDLSVSPLKNPMKAVGIKGVHHHPALPVFILCSLGVWIPGTAIPYSSELSCAGNLNSGPLEEWSVLLTTELSL